MPDRTTDSVQGSPPIAVIDTPAVQRLLGQAATTFVDVRPLAAYHGWRLGPEARGGHIPGAKAFPATWLDTVDPEHHLALLTARGLSSGGPVVVYGHGGEDAAAVARRLIELGERQTVVYAEGWAEWAFDPRRPVERLPRYGSLVHPEWLLDLMGARQPEAAPNDDWLLFHVNSGLPEEYADSHLPGALYLDTNRLEGGEIWNRRSPGELSDALKALGIGRDTPVLLYGRDTDGQAEESWPVRRAGQIAATRAALILRYAGVDDVRVLDGGYDAWVRAGHPLETVVREPTRIAHHGLRIPERPELMVDMPEARRILDDAAGAALVSVRTWEEQIGLISGYDYIGPAGRIAGDVWGNAGGTAGHEHHYRTVDNTMRPYPEIAADWAEAGITPDKRVAFYCGTGWRAAEAWFCAYTMGWDRVAVYDGGWIEWSQDPIANPIEIGPMGAGPTPARTRLSRSIRSIG